MLEFLKDLSLLKRIAIGILLGIICGIFLPHWTFITIFGSLFVGALKAIAPILVFVLILASISQHDSENKSYLKPVITLYLAATLCASVVAVLASFLFPVKIALQHTTSQQAAPQSINEVLNTILTNIVQNPLQAMIEGNYLAVLFWSALIGFALRLASPAVKKATQEIAQAITLVVQLIIAFAPLGIFGLVFQSVATTGLKGLLQYGQLLLLLVGSMFFVALVVYPIMVVFLIRENPYPLVFYCLKNSAIPAFFTRSSAANIPINMLLAKNMGLTESAYSISLPLGATINMGGAAITISTMTLAAVHTLDMQVSPILTLILCILSALSACGASGIAGGSLLLIPLACSLFGISNDIAIQVVGVGFIIGVVQDAIETAVNSSSDILFTAAAEFRDLRKNNQDIHLKERLSK
ncbi:serine/threonine transporter SstT [uncultured Enterococcus sp.]|uniref:serine/threonine transporter SstT n=1 Tax=uncultured Enterococcus sp. TaxID=167972 RepID=UPI00261110D4|nr:serine/threonine transporter SstT [uncultured Enterococcus sp.]